MFNLINFLEKKKSDLVDSKCLGFTGFKNLYDQTWES